MNIDTDIMDMVVERITKFILSITSAHGYYCPDAELPVVGENSEGIDIHTMLYAHEDRSNPGLGFNDEGDWTFITSKTSISCPDPEIRYRVIRALPEVYCPENYDGNYERYIREIEKEYAYEAVFAS